MTVSAKYPPITSDSCQRAANDSATAATASTMPHPIAARTLTSPAATGRLRLRGCWRSDSTSIASLMKYVLLAARQKHTNAMRCGTPAAAAGARRPRPARRRRARSSTIASDAPNGAVRGSGARAPRSLRALVRCSRRGQCTEQPSGPRSSRVGISPRRARWWEPRAGLPGCSRRAVPRRRAGSRIAGAPRGTRASRARRTSRRSRS